MPKKKRQTISYSNERAKRRTKARERYQILAAKRAEQRELLVEEKLKRPDFRTRVVEDALKEPEPEDEEKRKKRLYRIATARRLSSWDAEERKEHRPLELRARENLQTRFFRSFDEDLMTEDEKVVAHKASKFRYKKKFDTDPAIRELVHWNKLVLAELKLKFWQQRRKLLNEYMTLELGPKLPSPAPPSWTELGEVMDHNLALLSRDEGDRTTKSTRESDDDSDIWIKSEPESAEEDNSDEECRGGRGEGSGMKLRRSVILRSLNKVISSLGDKNESSSGSDGEESNLNSADMTLHYRKQVKNAEADLMSSRTILEAKHPEGREEREARAKEREALKEKIFKEKEAIINAYPNKLIERRKELAAETLDERIARIAGLMEDCMENTRWLVQLKHLPPEERVNKWQDRPKRNACEKEIRKRLRLRVVRTPERQKPPPPPTSSLPPAERKAYNAKQARIRIKMERGEYELFMKLLQALGKPEVDPDALTVPKRRQEEMAASGKFASANPALFEDLLGTKDTIRMIDYWYYYSRKFVGEEIGLYRDLFGQFAKKRKKVLPGVMIQEPPERADHEPTEDFEVVRASPEETVKDMRKLEDFLSDKVKAVVKKHLSYKRFYLAKKVMERGVGYYANDPEAKEKFRREQNARIRRSYHKKKRGIDIGMGNYFDRKTGDVIPGDVAPPRKYEKRSDAWEKRDGQSWTPESGQNQPETEKDAEKTAETGTPENTRKKRGRKRRSANASEISVPAPMPVPVQMRESTPTLPDRRSTRHRTETRRASDRVQQSSDDEDSSHMPASPYSDRGDDPDFDPGFDSTSTNQWIPQGSVGNFNASQSQPYSTNDVAYNQLGQTFDAIASQMSSWNMPQLQLVNQTISPTRNQFASSSSAVYSNQPFNANFSSQLAHGHGSQYHQAQMQGYPSTVTAAASSFVYPYHPSTVSSSTAWSQSQPQKVSQQQSYPPSYSVSTSDNIDDWEEVPPPPSPTSTSSYSQPQSVSSSGRRGRPKGSKNKHPKKGRNLIQAVSAASKAIRAHTRRRSNIWKFVRGKNRCTQNTGNDEFLRPHIVCPLERDPAMLRTSAMEQVMIKCKQCSEQFISENDLKTHENEMHSAEKEIEQAVQTISTDAGEKESEVANDCPEETVTNVTAENNEPERIKKKHTCPICFTEIEATMHGIVQHIFIYHWSRRTLQCPLRADNRKCKNTKYERNGLRNHILKKHLEVKKREVFLMGLHHRRMAAFATKFYCLYCPDQLNFESYYELRIHCANIHDKVRVCCVHCGIFFRREDHREDHIRLFHPEVRDGPAPPPISVEREDMFVCPDCDSEFSSQSFLDQHVAQGHSLVGDTVNPSRRCSFCYLDVPRKTSLDQHHHTCFASSDFCGWCGLKVSSQKLTIEEHLAKSHPKEPLFNPSEFPDKYAETPYKCELCTTSYLGLYSLRYHFYTEHKLADYFDQMKEKGISYPGGEEEDQAESSVPRPPRIDSDSSIILPKAPEVGTSVTCSKCPAGPYSVHVLHQVYDRVMKRYCPPCDRIFSRNPVYFQHNEAAHGISPEETEVLIAAIPPVGQEMKTSDEGHVQCVKCNLCFTPDEIHTFHKFYDRDPEIRTCHYCGQTFNYQQAHLNHLHTVHNVEKNTKFQTATKKNPPKPQELTPELIEKLMATSVVDFPDLGKRTVYSCRVCLKNFKTKGFLEKHIVENHKEDAFTRQMCPQCFGTFATLQNLKKHMKSKHGKLERWMCYLCDGSFARTYHIYHHLRNVHRQTVIDKSKIKKVKGDGSTEQNFHTCSICNRMYRSEQGLKNHMTAEHFFQNSSTFCEHCGLQMMASQLKWHLRQHREPNASTVKEQSGSAGPKKILNLMEVTALIKEFYEKFGPDVVAAEKRKPKARNKSKRKKSNVRKKQGSEEDEPSESEQSEAESFLADDLEDTDVEEEIPPKSSTKTKRKTSSSRPTRNSKSPKEVLPVRRQPARSSVKPQKYVDDFELEEEIENDGAELEKPEPEPPKKATKKSKGPKKQTHEPEPIDEVTEPAQSEEVTIKLEPVDPDDLVVEYESIQPPPKKRKSGKTSKSKEKKQEKPVRQYHLKDLSIVVENCDAMVEKLRREVVKKMAQKGRGQAKTKTKSPKASSSSPAKRKATLTRFQPAPSSPEPPPSPVFGPDEFEIKDEPIDIDESHMDDDAGPSWELLPINAANDDEGDNAPEKDPLDTSPTRQPKPILPKQFVVIPLAASGLRLQPILPKPTFVYRM